MELVFQRYFYLWGVLIVLPLWVLIILNKPKSRREVIYMGLIFATASMFLDKYCAIYDYWKPHFIFNDFNFESLLYGFFVGGLSTKIYELVFKQEYVSENEPNSKLMLIITLVTALSWVLLLLFLALNTIYLMLIIMLVWALVFILFKPKMLKLSLVSGVLMLVINVAWYAAILAVYPQAVHDIWFTGNLSGLYVLGVPIEEHCFLFMLGVLGSLIFKVLTKAEIDRSRALPSKTRYSLKPYRLPLILLVLAIIYIGLWGDKGRIFISPLTDDSRPTFHLAQVTIVSPTSGARYKQGEKIRFAAIVTGRPERIKWTSGLDGDFENKRLDFIKDDLSPGRHHIALQVTLGGQTHSKYVRLIIMK